MQKKIVMNRTTPPKMSLMIVRRKMNASDPEIPTIGMARSVSPIIANPSRVWSLPAAPWNSTDNRNAKEAMMVQTPRCLVHGVSPRKDLAGLLGIFN